MKKLEGLSKTIIIFVFETIYAQDTMASLLKIIVDVPCQVYCDYEYVGDAYPNGIFKSSLRKGVYYLQFISNNVVLESRDYIIAEDEMDYLLRLSLESQYNKAHREDIAEKIAALDVELVFHDGNQWIKNKSDGTETALPFNVGFNPDYDPLGYYDPNKENIDYCGLINAFKVEKSADYYRGAPWGCFNKKGEVQIPFVYEKKVHFENSEVTVAHLEGKSIFINRWGEIAFDNPFDNVDDYHGNYCVVNVHGKAGVINQYGDFIIPPTYDDVCIKGDPDFILLVQKGEKYGVLRDVNDEIIAIQYDEIIPLGNDSLRVFIARIGDIFRLLNKDGQTIFESTGEIKVIDNQYHYRRFPYFFVKEEKNCGVIRFDGQVIVPIDFDDIKPYMTYESQLSKDYVSFVVKQGDSYGLYDQDGENVAPVEYSSIEQLDFNSQDFFITKDGQKGLFHNGRQSIPPTFTSITRNDYNYGVVFVENGEGKKGMLKIEDGSELIPVQFDDIKSFGTKGPKPHRWITRHYIVNENSHWGVYNNDGVCIISVEYDSIEIPNPDTIIASKDGKIWLFNSGDGFQRSHSIDSFQLGWEEQIIIKLDKGSCVYDGNKGDGGIKITRPYFDSILKASSGKCYIVEKDGKYGLINSDGKVLCDCQYDCIDVKRDFIIRQRNRKLLLTDYSWNPIPFPDYTFTGLQYSFDSLDSLAFVPVVAKGGKLGGLNKPIYSLSCKDEISSIHEVIPCEYDDVSTRDGLIKNNWGPGEVDCFIKRNKKGLLECFEYKLDEEGNSYVANNWLVNNPDFKYIFIDTETTGLPRDPYASPYDLKNWPRIVQISWIITGGRGQVLHKDNYIIKPSGFSIPNKASKLHGIDDKRASLEGKPIEFVLNKLIEDCNGVNCLVGYNISFDEHVIDAELIRADLPLVFEEMETFCVMKPFGVFFNSGDGNGARWHYPSLEDLYLQFFNHFLSNAHNSASDIQATMEIFWELRKREIERFNHPEESKENDDDDIDADLPF